MDETRPMVTISERELDRLAAIEIAAIRMISKAPTRNQTPEQHDEWLAAMNELGNALPVSRRFDYDPIR